MTAMSRVSKNEYLLLDSLHYDSQRIADVEPRWELDHRVVKKIVAVPGYPVRRAPVDLPADAKNRNRPNHFSSSLPGDEMGSFLH